MCVILTSQLMLGVLSFQMGVRICPPMSEELGKTEYVARSIEGRTLGKDRLAETSVIARDKSKQISVLVPLADGDLDSSLQRPLRLLLRQSSGAVGGQLWRGFHVSNSFQSQTKSYPKCAMLPQVHRVQRITTILKWLYLSSYRTDFENSFCKLYS